jgi:hypothetical protein
MNLTDNNSYLSLWAGGVNPKTVLAKSTFFRQRSEYPDLPLDDIVLELNKLLKPEIVLALHQAGYINQPDIARLIGLFISAKPDINKVISWIESSKQAGYNTLKLPSWAIPYDTEPEEVEPEEVEPEEEIEPEEEPEGFIVFNKEEAEIEIKTRKEAYNKIEVRQFKPDGISPRLNIYIEEDWQKIYQKRDSQKPLSEDLYQYAFFNPIISDREERYFVKIKKAVEEKGIEAGVELNKLVTAPSI